MKNKKINTLIQIYFNNSKGNTKMYYDSDITLYYILLYIIDIAELPLDQKQFMIEKLVRHG